MRIVINTSIGDISYRLTDEELRQAHEEYEKKIQKEDILDKAYTMRGAELPEDFPFPEVADEIKKLLNENDSYMDVRWETTAKATVDAIDKFAMRLWDEFGDVPMNPETECIDTPWRDFPAGTHREEIWYWFEDTLGVRVIDLMNECTIFDAQEETANSDE